MAKELERSLAPATNDTSPSREEKKGRVQEGQRTCVCTRVRERDRKREIERARGETRGTDARVAVAVVRGYAGEKKRNICPYERTNSPMPKAAMNDRKMEHMTIHVNSGKAAMLCGCSLTPTSTDRTPRGCGARSLATSQSPAQHEGGRGLIDEMEHSC